jgi:hypothetical protein
VIGVEPFSRIIVRIGHPTEPRYLFGKLRCLPSSKRIPRTSFLIRGAEAIAALSRKPITILFEILWGFFLTAINAGKGFAFGRHCRFLTHRCTVTH